METNANYHCGQDELYSGCRLVVRAAIRHIADFTPKKPKYVAAFFSTLQAEIAAAELLPGEQYRDSYVTAMRIKLKEKATVCLNKWQDLKGYIEDAVEFAGDMQKPALASAGLVFYDKASGDDWESVNSLMVNGKLFISDHTADLTADNNMPATFSAEWDTVFGEYGTELAKFQDAEELAPEMTEQKITANNDVFKKVIQVCKDGQRIFRSSEAIRNEFVWEHILLLLRGTGIAGLRGTVSNSVSGDVITGALVTIEETGDSGVSDALGVYRITGVPAGVYSVKVTATGFNEFSTSFEVLTGTVSGLDVEMVPL